MSAFDGSSASKRVLLVDDDVAVLRRAATYLRSRGFAVHTATAVSHASVLLDTLKFDAVVTDLDIPPDGPSAGLDVASIAALRNFTSRPLVVLWSREPSVSLLEAREHGFHDFVVKGAEADLAEVLVRRLTPASDSGSTPIAT